jgi:endonuclease III
MNARKIYEIFIRFSQHNPQPTSELIYNSPFEMLIAVMLSAQATDVSVNKATEVLFKVAKTPSQILALGEEKLKTYLKSIGLYNTKAANVIRTSQILIEKYNAEVPNEREALESLPGVGRKTANVILNTAFGHPTIAVDTHIFRVANRTGMAIGRTPLAVEMVLLKVIPKEFRLNAHHWLVLHGRYTCVARKPHCATCCINDLCEYEAKCFK